MTHEQMLQQFNYQHIGEAGEHVNHYLVCDDMGDVWCQTCRAYLGDDAAEIAWPN